jgi:hypothetical protein
MPKKEEIWFFVVVVVLGATHNNYLYYGVAKNLVLQNMLLQINGNHIVAKSTMYYHQSPQVF